MLKLRFDWYITTRENEGTEREAPIRQALGYVNSAEVTERLPKTAKVRFFMIPINSDDQAIKNRRSTEKYA